MENILASAGSYNKTRLAPTPSGYLHLGNVLSFAITASLAIRTNAGIFLRIDDLDRARFKDVYLQDIFDTLNFLEIPWDEGPKNASEFLKEYSQVHRIPIYERYLIQLREEGFLYPCRCSRQELGKSALCHCAIGKMKENPTGVNWRLRDLPEGLLSVIEFNNGLTNIQVPEEMHRLIVRKKDGYPSYQLASMVDDLFYGIDLIVRGEDLLPSTLAQLHLATLLKKPAFSQIAFYHHPLLKNADGTKLSKSAGATSVRYLREAGYSAADIFNVIARNLKIGEPVNSWKQLGDLLISKRISFGLDLHPSCSY